MIPALQSAASGMNLGFAMLDRAAHNVANLHTEGYQRRGVAAREAAGGGVQVREAPAGGGGLEEDLVTAMLARHTVAANAAVARRAESTLGSLIDVLA